MTEPRKTANAGAAPVIPLFEFPQFDLPKFDLPKFDLPKFDLPKFELPKFELPAELRAMTGVLEHSYAAASEGAAEYNRQVVDAARANANAGFDYAIALLAVKSPTDVVEVSTAHARERFQALAEQAKVLGALVQKLAAETAEPIQTGVTKAFQNAA